MHKTVHETVELSCECIFNELTIQKTIIEVKRAVFDCLEKKNELLITINEI